MAEQQNTLNHRNKALLNDIDHELDGAPYLDTLPIIEHTSIKDAVAVMALDLAGVVRVIDERLFNRTEVVDVDGIPTERGIYELGFSDISTIHHARLEQQDDGSEKWVVAERIAISGLNEWIKELEGHLTNLDPSNDLLASAGVVDFIPPEYPLIEVNASGAMQLLVPDESTELEKIANRLPNSTSRVEVSIGGVMKLLASAKLKKSVCLGPEDPTVALREDGTICMFVTLAVQNGFNSWRFETLMAQGSSLYQLEAVGFVPLGLIKELSFGPVYPTKQGSARMVLGEGSVTGYSTVRAAEVGADFALDSFRDKGIVSLFPPNIHDRFAEYYTGSTDTPETARYRWVGEHISPNKVIDHDVIPLFDGWHAVMTSGRSRIEATDLDTHPPMGPFEIGLSIIQLDPNHEYAGECIWVDDRPLFHLNGAESITFGSDWYIKQDDTTGLDRTIVFIVHRDDRDICPVEMPLRAVWDRIPEFLKNADKTKTATAAAIVIAPHLDLNIEKRFD